MEQPKTEYVIYRHTTIGEKLSETLQEMLDNREITKEMMQKTL